MRGAAAGMLLVLALPCATSFGLFPAQLATRSRARPAVRPQGRIPCAAAADGIDKDLTRSLDTAEALISGLRSRTATDTNSGLDLATDFYDPSTGLHSEGVWHNALIGISCLALMKSGRATEELQEAPGRIAESLAAHNWDGVSFRRRAHSGRWNHSVPDSALEQPAYYVASEEHRCVQHGMACVFWSFLREVQPEAAKDFAPIAASFVDQFWDEEAGHWTTISRAQGVATAARPSASSGKSFSPAPASGEATGAQGLFEEVGGRDQVYYRAVDHAVALLALVSMVGSPLQSCSLCFHQAVVVLCLASETPCLQERRWEPGDPVDQDRLQDLIRITSQQLLSPAGFGYGGDYSDSNPNPWTRSYIGLGRRRNFWHDAWVALALVCARSSPAAVSSGVCEAQLKSLLAQLVGVYGGAAAAQGTVWHWAVGERRRQDGNVRYCGDNALLHAICCELQVRSESQHERQREGY